MNDQMNDTNTKTMPGLVISDITETSATVTVSLGVGDGPVYLHYKVSGASESQPRIELEATGDTVEFMLDGLTAGLTYLVSASRSRVADFSIFVVFDTITMREG